MINGVPVGYFGSSHGLRQGDPISLLLFLLVVEVLGAMLAKAVSVGMLEGFSVGSGQLSVSHLQFANDTLILCSNSQRQIRFLRCILRCFEGVPGLKVNLAKSALIGVGEVPNLDMLAADLGCRIGSLPVTYFSLPLGVRYKSVNVWNPVVERIQRRLSCWKANYLSKGGSMTLLKAALANILVYYLSLFNIPLQHRKL